MEPEFEYSLHPSGNRACLECNKSFDEFTIVSEGFGDAETACHMATSLRIKIAISCESGIQPSNWIY